MTETFRWRVTSDSSSTHTFAVRTVKLGDGYEQRQPLSLRTKINFPQFNQHILLRGGQGFKHHAR